MMNYYLLLLMVISLNQDLSLGKCIKKIKPMANFQMSDAEGTYYFIAQQMGGYNIQTLVQNCGYSVGRISGHNDKDWIFTSGYVLPNGTETYIRMNVTMGREPGSFISHNFEDGQPLDFETDVIAAKPHIFHIFLLCNGLTHEEIVLILYHKRVDGLDNIDPESLQEIKKALADNDIDMNNLVKIKQAGCTNTPVT